MDKFRIVGGSKICGEITVDTAKNSLLPILAGSILTNEQIQIKNVTYYSDINSMIEILNHLGVVVKKMNNSIIIDASNINCFDIPQALTSKLRASIFFVGPLLTKLKRARVSYPGGCCIGARPIDIHLNCLIGLGAEVVEKHGYIDICADKMKSGIVHLSFPSVGATENLIMASVKLRGITTLIGVAKEPEIVDLCDFLNQMGARIKGHGTDVIEIEGVENLYGTTYKPISDRIVAGTYLMLPLICGGELVINNANYSHILPFYNLVSNNACNVKAYNDKIVVLCNRRLKSFGKIETMPYPHFPTDLQQQLCALSSVCKGTTIIVENMFENRFNHVQELTKMGANISVKDRVCVVQGVKTLYGAEVVARDLRGGASLTLAGLCADGYTTILGADIIDRGYFQLEDKLSKIGANIKRIVDN